MKTGKATIIVNQKVRDGRLTTAMITLSNISPSNARNAGRKGSGGMLVIHLSGIIVVKSADTILNRLRTKHEK